MSELMLMENPYRRRRRRARRNPAAALAMPKIAREWLGGMDLMEMGAALGGLAASTMLPGMLVKETGTMGQKILKAIASFGSAIGAGFVFRNVSPSAGKYAIAAGMAGALAQTLGLFTGLKIGQPMRFLPRGRMGDATLVSPAYSREQESVSVIEP